MNRIFEAPFSLEDIAPAPSLDLPWQHDIVALRRDFHQHPELGYEEIRTSDIVAKRLRALGLEVQTGVGVTGVIGVLKGAKPGPTVLVRADMDALPVDEKNAWNWKSKVAGKMHACGHDAHTAVGLTVARLLAERKNELCGVVKFMFQPAEEGLGGAERMMNDGLLNDPEPDFALALHVWSDLPVGTVAMKAGPAMASADSFSAKIIGKGGHGAIPQQTIDPVVVASHVVVALQTAISRSISPLDPGVVTVGKVWAGSAFNVIPGEAIIEGTVRAFTEDVRSTLERRCREIVEELPRAFGARGEFHYKKDFPPTVNDARVTEIVRRAAQSVVGEENVQEWQPTMGAEDFSLVLQHVPGCYFFVGGRNEAIGASYAHHHDHFNIDERALLIGAQTMCAAVKECLKS